MRRSDGRPRSDAYPERFPYKDDGCEVSSKCTECPLPVCKEEFPGGSRQLAFLLQLGVVVELKRRGLTVREIGAEVGRGKRTVNRFVTEARRRRLVQSGVSGRL